MKKLSLSLLTAFFIFLSMGAGFFVPPLSITHAKLAALPIQQSGTTNITSTNSASFSTLLTTLSPLTTTGRPVFVGLTDDGSNSSEGGSFGCSATTGAQTSVACDIEFFRDSTQISSAIIMGVAGASSSGMNSTVPASAYYFIDTGASAGTHNYTIKWRVESTNYTFFAYQVRLTAYEL